MTSAAAAAIRCDNIWTNKYFAISMGAIMVLFGIKHWTGVLFHHYGPKNSSLPRAYRKISSITIDIKGVDGSYFLYAIYWAINLILTLCDLDLTNLGYVAKRIGWISVANLVLLVFLALKNTPLAPLTAKSYEKLRPLHKVAGYTCIVTSCIHGILYLKALSEYKELIAMTERQNYAGAIAGLSMVIIGLSTFTFFMRRFYELFYILHIVMFLLIMITVGMHRPKFKSSTVITVIFIACLWTTDRLLRSAKMIWNFFGNRATITALPDNAIRVKLSRGMRSTPGSHAFLWVPALRWVESHPFTLLSSDPSEFVVRAYDGFTQELYAAAQNAPGMSLRCSVDGPYGQIPDFKTYDRAVLVAGGSGASFTFAVALNLVKTPAKSVRTIDFIWVVRYKECIEWFAPEIEILQCHPNVNLQIYVTRHDELSDGAGFGPPPSDVDIVSKETAFGSPADPEKGNPKVVTTSSALGIVRCHSGRPDMDDIISTSLLLGNTEDDRIIVGACGPSELMKQTRKAVRVSTLDEGPSVKLYTEEFKW